MKPKCYKDFLQQEIDRCSGNTIYSRNHIKYHQYAKKIKRKEILDISVEILEI